MKSATALEIPIIGLIGTIAIIGGILIPPSIIEMTIDKELAFTYEYEKIQLTLLTLLSSTHEGKPVYEIIANNINAPENLEFLKKDLNEIIKSKCYSIQVRDENDFTTLIENGNCNKKYQFTIVLSLPYNPDSRIKLLRIDAG